LKHIFYNIGFTLSLVVGCHATLQENKSQPEFTGAPPSTIVAEPLVTNDSSAYTNVVKDFFEQKLLHGSFNGGVLVAKGNEIIYEKYQGYEDLRTKATAIDEATPMHVASVSKNFAAAAILKLSEENKLQISQPLTDFFPNFPYTDVTVEMLLSHRSGLPDYMHFLEKYWIDKNSYANNNDVLTAMINYQPKIEFKAGTRFEYSNTNFVLLALVIEKVTGLPYPEYMKKTFFEPLQMQDTYVASVADMPSVTPSFAANGRYWQTNFMDATYGDKNIYTTPRDLLKWSLAVSQGKVIRQSLVDSAFTPYSNEKKTVHNYGFGWRLLMLPNDKKVIYHNGKWHGTNASLAMLPEDNVTIIVIGNRYNSNIYNVARASYNLFGDYIKIVPQRHWVAKKHYKHSSKRSVAKKKSSHKTYTSSSSRPVAKNAR
jgi:CubicO group peptidase (beta-lactamase class C family)